MSKLELSTDVEQLLKQIIQDNLLDYLRDNIELVRCLIKVNLDDELIFTIQKMVNEKFNCVFDDEHFSGRINTMIWNFDKNLTEMIKLQDARLTSLEQDLLDTVGALKKYMDK